MVWLLMVIGVSILVIGSAMLFVRRKRRKRRGGDVDAVGLRSGTRAVSERYRVAVVGGGIAGCAAAWALRRGGVRVTLYEKKARIGGNANTHDWPLVGGSSDNTFRSGLSVLAWPKAYFRHYARLLTTLGVASEDVSLPFCVEVASSSSHTSNKTTLSHTSSPTVHSTLVGDLTRWTKMIHWIRKCNAWFCGNSDRLTLYEMSFWNPLNLIPLRWISLCFGVSSTFWNTVVVPVHASTFLSTNLSWVPAVIAPIMDDIVPLERCPVLVSWSENSSQVFDRLVEGVDVRTSVDIDCVSSLEHGGKSAVQLADGSVEFFDRIVFACSADATCAMLQRGTSPMPWFLSFLLSYVSYVDDDWGSEFLDGSIHSDTASVLSTPVGQKCLDAHSNYIGVEENGTMSCTFILRSWVPAAVRSPIRHMIPPMLVTYGSAAKKVRGGTDVKFRRAHPHLCVRNLVIAFLLRWYQGKRGHYFAGSYTTPGNGHDLSLCSGLVAAYNIGAGYPFANDPECVKDFLLVQELL